MSEWLPARRKRIVREDGSILSYSIPEGVTDEQAAAEVARCKRAVRRGYSIPLRFHDDDGFKVDVRWLLRQPPWIVRLVLLAQRASRWRRPIFWAFDRAHLWLRCRWLDGYWFVRDRLASSPPAQSPAQTPEQAKKAKEGKQ